MIECTNCGATFGKNILERTGECPICNEGGLVKLVDPKAALALTYQGKVIFAAPIRLHIDIGYPMWMAYNSARVACEKFAEDKFKLHPDGWHDEWGEWFYRRSNGWLKIGLVTYDGGEICL